MEAEKATIAKLAASLDRDGLPSTRTLVGTPVGPLPQGEKVLLWKSKGALGAIDLLSLRVVAADLRAALRGVVLIAAGVAWALIDVNSYRGTIQSQLQGQLNRSVTLGKMNLHIFPLQFQVENPVIGEDAEAEAVSRCRVPS